MLVMMLTSKGGRPFKSRAKQTSAEDHLVKAFGPDELVCRVEALLVGRDISRAVMRS